MYNAEQYLEECILSVLRQTYEDWEYIIVNNCSTDKSLIIANKYAAKEKRIRIIDNIEFLTAIQNQNYALKQISRKSKYCKIFTRMTGYIRNALK